MFAEKDTPLGKSVGITQSYMNRVRRGVSIPSRKVAIKLFRKTGVKLAPIENLTDEEIDLLEKLEVGE